MTDFRKLNRLSAYFSRSVSVKKVSRMSLVRSFAGRSNTYLTRSFSGPSLHVYRPVSAGLSNTYLTRPFARLSLHVYRPVSAGLSNTCLSAFRRSFSNACLPAFRRSSSNACLSAFRRSLSNACLSAFRRSFSYACHPAFRRSLWGNFPLRTQTCNLLIEPVSRALLSLRNCHNRNYSDRLRSYYNRGALPCRIGYLVWHPRVIVLAVLGSHRLTCYRRPLVRNYIFGNLPVNRTLICIETLAYHTDVQYY